MKALALRLKKLAVKLLDLILMAAYPSLNEKPDNWWKYVDY
jgi:hypothetical protein